MICRRCLQRASALPTRLPRPQPNTLSLPIRTTALRPISSTTSRRASSPAPQPAPAGATTPGVAETQAPPVFGTPLSSDASSSKDKPTPLSACPEGTVMTGLNYFKNRTDPVALADEAYPEWLWRCLDVQKKADDGEGDDAGDEFSKSRKQRRIAAKRQRQLEARLLAEGNIEALAPKIPLQHQSINLPGSDGTVEGAVAAQDAREDLRKAMRRERRAKIKESNYLKSM
ncbi:mitochondrial ribosomal protein L37-domain-containing protein [Xylariaceae sp. FL0016]|nr:mitochondrial ribosomal protein L37-domain-containing protein [Xylariaceae sp. FL0016]